jgi:hypothetical protein
VVDGPDGLKVVLHLLLERLWHCMHCCELLQVAPLRVILGPGHNFLPAKEKKIVFVIFF